MEYNMKDVIGIGNLESIVYLNLLYAQVVNLVKKLVVEQLGKQAA